MPTNRNTESKARRIAAGILLPYGLALLSVVAATVLTFPVQSVTVHSLALLFMVAVLVSAWYGGTWPGLVSVVLSTLSFHYFFSRWAGTFQMHGADVLRLLVFASVALTISFLTAHRRAALLREQLLNVQLQRAMEEIKILRGILPICMYCKHIRTDSGSWERLEKYITEHSEADFTHGICPECYEKHHPELYKQLHKK